jgi:hypothetical protein
MAKISARGDVEAARWHDPHTDSTLVLTQRGRLLRKERYDSTYHLVPLHRVKVDGVLAFIKQIDGRHERVPVRRGKNG